ncbi:hypothetical protein HDV02_004699, partial [Globomyces sp. JEL0801]
GKGAVSYPTPNASARSNVSSGAGFMDLPRTPTPSRNLDSVTLLTPVATTLQTPSHNGDITPNPSNTSGINERPPVRTGREINVFDVTNHPKWVCNLKQTTWQPLTPFIKQLVLEDGQPATMLLFGTISMSFCGRYGDFVPQFRDSLTKANMKWTLRVPTEHQALFLSQVQSIKDLSNSVSEMFKENALIAQRPAKNDAEFEVRCKLVRKRRANSVVVQPEDMENKSYWKRCVQDGFEPNTLPLGVISYEGQVQDFINYENTLQSGTSVVVTARMQAAFFQDKPYVQIVPLKFQKTGQALNSNRSGLWLGLRAYQLVAAAQAESKKDPIKEKAIDTKIEELSPRLPSSAVKNQMVRRTAAAVPMFDGERKASAVLYFTLKFKDYVKALELSTSDILDTEVLALLQTFLGDEAQTRMLSILTQKRLKELTVDAWLTRLEKDFYPHEDTERARKEIEDTRQGKDSVVGQLAQLNEELEKSKVVRAVPLSPKPTPTKDEMDRKKELRKTIQQATPIFNGEKDSTVLMLFYRMCRKALEIMEYKTDPIGAQTFLETRFGPNLQSWFNAKLRAHKQ